MVKCEEFVISDLLIKGDGKETPVRRIIQIYKKDGELLAENDPIGNFNIEQLIMFENAVKNGVTLKEWMKDNFNLSF